MDKPWKKHTLIRSVAYPFNILQIGKINDKLTEYKPGNVINFIVEFQPNNSEGFHNVVGIELNDISTLSDKSFAGIKEFEEESQF